MTPGFIHTVCHVDSLSFIFTHHNIISLMGSSSSKANAEVWERYEPKRFLGNGASAQVYVAKDRSADKSAAWVVLKLLKRYPSDPSKEEHMRTAYRAEVHLLKQLNHPQIVSLLDSFETKEHFVIVTQFLAGGQLYDYMGDMHQYNEQSASRMAKQLLQAVYFCHKHNIIHRDLKPANCCFASRSGNSFSALKLIDFGLALQIEDDQVWENGAGTPYYMAPEIIDNTYRSARTGKVLKASDMWSMGVIIFMILTGSPPFTGKTDEEIMSAILKDEYKVPDTLSDSAKDLISKLLELDVNKRLTAEQALKHPWIENSDQNSDKNLTNVVSKFATFSSKTLIKKTVSSLMLKQTEDADKLMSLFKMLDVDGDRVLDQSELASYVQNHCFDDVNSQKIALDLINMSPESKQRRGINYLEFEHFHARGLLGPLLMSIHESFQVLDDRRENFIAFCAIEKLNVPELSATFKEMFQNVNVDIEGHISFRDFLVAFTAENVKKIVGKSRTRLRAFISSTSRALLSHSTDLKASGNILRQSSFHGLAINERYAIE